MKLRLLAFVLPVTTCIFLSDRPVHAGETKFICGNWQGIPATMAETAKGKVPIITWVSDYFDTSGFNSRKRCQIVSQKFQQYYNEGTLKYLTTGRKQGNNIVCVAKVENGACSGQLFTLKPGSNPGETLKQLMSIRSQASGVKPINESSDRVYIDFDRYLQEASNSNNNASNRETQPQKTPHPQSDSDRLW